jgi:hypothetical protein
MDTIQSIGDFLIFTVFIKFIIVHWIGERTYDFLKKLFTKTPRTNAIWTHYQSRALGEGHESDDVLACGQERCQVFAV